MYVNTYINIEKRNPGTTRPTAIRRIHSNYVNRSEYKEVNKKHSRIFFVSINYWTFERRTFELGSTKALNRLGLGGIIKKRYVFFNTVREQTTVLYTNPIGGGLRTWQCHSGEWNISWLRRNGRCTTAVAANFMSYEMYGSLLFF